MNKFDGTNFEHANYYTQIERLVMLKIMEADNFPCKECSSMLYGAGCRSWSCPDNKFLVWFMKKHLKQFQSKVKEEKTP